MKLQGETRRIVPSPIPVQYGGNCVNVEESRFYGVEDVSRILGVSKSKAYKVIKEINDELSRLGLITLHGKVSKRYFNEKVAL